MVRLENTLCIILEKLSTFSCGILIFNSFTSVFLNVGRLTFPNVPSQWAIGSRLTRPILLENSWPILPLNLTIHLEIQSIKYGHGSLGENGMIKKLVQMQKITMTDKLSFNGREGSQQVNWAVFLQNVQRCASKWLVTAQAHVLNIPSGSIIRLWQLWLQHQAAARASLEILAERELKKSH